MTIIPPKKIKTRAVVAQKEIFIPHSQANRVDMAIKIKAIRRGWEASKIMADSPQKTAKVNSIINFKFP